MNIPENSAGHHSADRSYQYDRHRHFESAAEDERFEDVVRQAGRDQQYGEDCIVNHRRVPAGPEEAGRDECYQGYRYLHDRQDQGKHGQQCSGRHPGKRQ